MNYQFVDYPFTARVYGPTIPALAQGIEARRHKVAIVGGGPVGLCVALGLANHGIASVLIEADNSVCFGSRAICISRRSQEILDRLGALESFSEMGLPWTGGRSFYRNGEVLRFEMPHDVNQKLPPMLNIEQFYIEQYLLDAAEARRDLIDIRWATRVTDVVPSESGVRLSLSTEGGDYAIDADWLVAADGGRSTVRESMGLALQGTSYEGRYVIVDIALDTDLPTERLAWFDPPSNPGSSILMHRQPQGVWRVDYQIGDDEDAEEAVKPENVIPRIQSHLEMIGQTGAWSPIWITMYRAHALTLDRYLHGRVLFAGDAAHLVPIFGVRGANSGIDDADNLAWKLAYVIKGLADPDLLESYSDERVFATHENLSFGTKSTEFMAPPSFAFKLMQVATLSLAARHAEVRSLINPRQTGTITYRESPLNAADDPGFIAGPPPGAVLQECPLVVRTATGVRDGYLTDLIEPRFTLLVFAAKGARPDWLQDLDDSDMAPSLSLRPLLLMSGPCDGSQADAWDQTGRLFQLYGAEEGCCYLVRPDGHVAGRWRTPDTVAIASAIAAILTGKRTLAG